MLFELQFVNASATSFVIITSWDVGIMHSLMLGTMLVKVIV